MIIHVIYTSSLYTSIPTEIGIEAISFWLHKKHGLIPQKVTNNFIIESLKFVLKNNNVLFDNHMFLQLEEQWAQNVLPRVLV